MRWPGIVPKFWASPRHVEGLAHEVLLMPSQVVIVTGPPCSGKTHLGHQIAERFALPFFTKDTLKEALFDRLGCGDASWSASLSLASYDLLMVIARSELTAGRSFVLESNFRPADWDRPLRALRDELPFEPIQIYCHAEVEALMARFRARWASGERHPGHIDTDAQTAIEASVRAGRYGPLEIGGHLLDIDTTDFARIDEAALLDQLAHLLTCS